MFIERKSLRKIIYNNLFEAILLEQEDITKTVSLPRSQDWNDRTVISKNNDFIPFENAGSITANITPERKAWIIRNLDSIDPISYVDDDGEYVSELTEEERTFYVLAKADKIQKDLSSKMSARKEEEQRVEAERIKAMFANPRGGDTTTLPTGVVGE